MGEVMAVRLSAEMRRKLLTTAKRRRMTASEAVREAVESWLERSEEQASPAARIADLIGGVHGGDPQRSAGGGARVARELVAQRDR
ncbi:MAG: hypothetical protein KA072_05430 [Thermoanaerobaculaceae bacterium]|nr:hypothetical protein [Thermoanaerobaculaceae bacterium]MDI9623260.1 hypothetical protein [Acidobacteriota bacterium]NLH10384.1 hypothetical protein [Holophagae bacterium]HPW56977.1 hypothetical protein [Thermoanaerobaculaceae bacterium]